MTTKSAEINDFSAGLVTDLPCWQVPPGAATDIQNVRFDDGCAQAFFQHRVLFTPAASPTGVCDFQNGAGNGRQLLIPCSNNNIYVYGTETGTANQVYTGAAALPNGNVDKWTYATYPNIIIATHSGQAPLYLADPDGFWESPPTSPSMALLPWDVDAASTWQSVGAKCIFMRQFGDMLMAFNMRESSGLYLSRVRWGEPYLPGDVPSTWDESRTDSIAGFYDVDGTEGPIWDARPLRGRMMIYKADGIWAASRTYGDDVFAFDSLFSDGRALITDTVVEFNGQHFCLTEGNAWVHNGVEIQSVINNKIGKRLLGELNDALSKVHVFKNWHRKEIWCCIPTGTSSYADRAFVWNWETGAWSERDIPDLVQVATLRLEDASQDGRFFQWAEYPVAASNDGVIYELDTMTTANGADPTCYWEKKGISLGDWRTATHINRIRLRMQSRVSVTVKVGHHDTPDGAITWDTTRTFDPDSDYKIDCHSGGRYHAIRIESNTSPVAAYTGEQAAGNAIWSLYGMTIDYVEQGDR